MAENDGLPTAERETRPVTVASSTETAWTLDKRQYAFDDGSCLKALREQRTVLIRDLQADEGWAWYAGTVADEGARIILAVPIPTDNGSRSALNCYSTQLHTFGPATVTAIEERAAWLSRILRLAIRVHPSDP